MEILVEELNALTRKVKIVLPATEVTKELDAAYNKLKSEVHLKGFRKGKVPRRILEQNFRPRVEAEVGEKLVQATYFDAIEKEKLDVVAHPEIKTHSFGEDGTFSYEAEVDTRPQFELQQFKGLEIEKNEITIDESEVNAELERLRKEMAPLRSVEERAVAVNDIAIIDFQGYDGGAPILQVKGVDASVDVGMGRNGTDFEEKLIGLRKGEESIFEVSFPTSSPNPVLAGKNIEFRVTVKDVKERILAEFDDEFAKDVGEQISTMKELREDVSAKLKQREEEAAAGDITDKLMQTLVDKHDFEVPGRLVQYEIDDYIKQTEQRLKANGVNLEAAGINKADMASRYRPVAEKRVRGDFILKKIAEQEAIKLEDDDINKGFNRIATQYNMTIDEVKGYFKRREDMLPFLNELLNEKILQMLQDEAKYIMVQPDKAEDSSATQQEPGEEA